MIRLVLLGARQAQRLDDRLDVAIHNARQIVRREADAMIGYAALGIVVRANLRRSVAAPHLRAANARAFRLLLRNAEIEKARTKNFHRLRLVLNLGSLVLLADDDAG